ncbi:MAG: hypothetical protein ACYTGW_01390 [Planctomycetota bacterium]|jgi:hypothetical protein
MRWILAGIAFALLVTLAVVTVAVKAGNRRTQARLENLSLDLVFVQVECARQAEWYYEQVQEDRLLERLRELSDVSSVGEVE